MTTKQELTEKIEILYAQIRVMPFASRERAVNEFALRNLTREYKALTGDYYRRTWVQERKT